MSDERFASEAMHADGSVNNQAGSKTANKTVSLPAQISLVHESADGRLCLFQDAEGHYTVVRADRLA